MLDPFDGNPLVDHRETAKYTMSVAVMMTGVPAYRIRRFEDYGLFKPSRTESRQRLFSDTNIEAIREIASLDSQGINLPGIRTILTIKQNGKT
jgi:DNA-binding transcriptional MerR regulator